MWQAERGDCGKPYNLLGPSGIRCRRPHLLLLIIRDLMDQEAPMSYFYLKPGSIYLKKNILTMHLAIACITLLCANEESSVQSK